MDKKNDAIVRGSKEVNLYSMEGGFLVTIPLLNLSVIPKVILWNDRVFELTEVVCEPESIYKAGERYTQSYPIPVPYRYQYRETAFYNAWVNKPLFETPKEAEDMSKIANERINDLVAQNISQRDKALNELLDRDNATCPVCGVDNHLHKRKCSKYQKDLEEQARKLGKIPVSDLTEG